MSHHDYHSLADLPKPGHFILHHKIKQALIGCVVVGVLTLLVAFWQDSTRAWYNFLINYFYWMSIGLFGAFFTALHHAVGAHWSTAIRRIAEAMSSFLPVAAILMLLLFFGIHHLYEWSHHKAVAADPLLSGKAAYLNISFFVIRSLVGMGAWCLFARYFVTKSLAQDTSGDVHITKSLIKASVIFLPIFGLTYTMASFDDIMSVEPHFFSTIFGVYQFASLFYSGITTLTIIVILLRKRGLFNGLVSDQHLHDLGKWMFAFCVFWAYIAFSQYMLIWYANLPEETFYFLKRQANGWGAWGLLLAFSKFIVPFFLLMSRWQKRLENYTLAVGGLVLLASWVDLFWLVAPTYSPDKVVFGWTEIGTWLGFMALFALVVARFLSRHPLVPIKDPYLVDSVNHHQF